MTSLYRVATRDQPLRVGVLVSGSGSNLQALLDDGLCEPAAVVEAACGAARWAAGEFTGNFARAARG